MGLSAELIQLMKESVNVKTEQWKLCKGKKKENTYNTCEKLIRLPKICEAQMQEKERKCGKQNKESTGKYWLKISKNTKTKIKRNYLKFPKKKTYTQETRKMAELSREEK